MHCCRYYLLQFLAQVPLGSDLKSEQKYEEMVDILSALHKNVPMDPSTEVLEVPGCDAPGK